MSLSALHLALRKQHTAANSCFHRYFAYVVFAAVALDLLLALAIIATVPYTEIDWKAYMEEVSGVIEAREFDYVNLRGGTGPLVYPAGFVYIYSLLFHATDRGTNILAAQFIFAVLHAATLGCAMYVYYMYCSDRWRDTSKCFPLYSAVLLLCSRRVMSLFVLRLFNDGVQSLFMYIAIIMFACNRWVFGCLWFSAAVSVKMNALLFAPAVAVLLCQALGPIVAALHVIFLCGGFQVLVGLPFLLHSPVSYLTKAFEFSRVFEYKWSVNGAFLPEDIFLDRRLSVVLLGVHIFVLLMFGHFCWTSQNAGGLRSLFAYPADHGGTPRCVGNRSFSFSRALPKSRLLRPSHVIRSLFTCNFIGIVFARTLHYQFYLWYFHSLPFLVFTSTLPTALGLVVLVVIELVFNIYPPRDVAALALLVSHVALLSAMFESSPRCENDIYLDGEKKTM